MLQNEVSTGWKTIKCTTTGSCSVIFRPERTDSYISGIYMDLKKKAFWNEARKNTQWFFVCLSSLLETELPSFHLLNPLSEIKGIVELNKAFCDWLEKYILQCSTMWHQRKMRRRGASSGQVHSCSDDKDEIKSDYYRAMNVQLVSKELNDLQFYRQTNVMHVNVGGEKKMYLLYISFTEEQEMSKHSQTSVMIQYFFFFSPPQNIIRSNY